MLDIRVVPLAIDAQAPDEQALELGAPPEVLTQITAGLFLPFEQSPGQGPIPIPFANIRFGLPKDAVLDLIRRLTEAAENLPDQSDLIIPGNMDQAEQYARQIGQFGGDSS